MGEALALILGQRGMRLHDSLHCIVFRDGVWRVLRIRL